MTGRRPDPDIDLRSVAAEVLAEAVDGARRDAVEQLRTRITAWLVTSAEGSLPAAVPPPGGVPAPGGAGGGSGGGGPRGGGRPRPAPAVEAGGEAGGPGWYAYGLTWDHVAGNLPAIAGVAGSPVEVVAVGRLALVGSWVDRADDRWGIDESGEADLDRLDPLVRAHEGVLEAVLDRGPVLPLRFGRLYPDPERLRDLVGRREETVAAALERLEGRAEWGLTLDWEPDQGAGAVPGAGRSDGAGYLAERRDRMAAADRAARQARSRAGAVHDALIPIADDHVVHRPRRPSGEERPVIWRASYLVGEQRLEEFRRAASDSLAGAPAELGLGGRLTGPWPPYHFADLDLDGVPA